MAPAPAKFQRLLLSRKTLIQGKSFRMYTSYKGFQEIKASPSLLGGLPVEGLSQTALRGATSDMT